MIEGFRYVKIELLPIFSRISIVVFFNFRHIFPSVCLKICCLKSRRVFKWKPVTVVVGFYANMMLYSWCSCSHLLGFLKTTLTKMSISTAMKTLKERNVHIYTLKQ